MSNAPRPDAVVIRFRPVSQERVFARAKQNARRSDGNGQFTASVWAEHAREGESRGQLIKRLLQASELEGIAPNATRITGVARRPKN